jgi:hypothetical protein
MAVALPPPFPLKNDNSSSFRPQGGIFYFDAVALVKNTNSQIQLSNAIFLPIPKKQPTFALDLQYV